jgi:hypothetical protein
MRGYLGGLGLVVIALGGCSAKPLAGAEELALMNGVACARLEGGTVACWGRNLGPKAVLVPAVHDALRIVAVTSWHAFYGAEAAWRVSRRLARGVPIPRWKA